MWNYIKQSLFAFIYLISLGVTELIIFSIESDVLKMVLFAVILGFYVFLLFMVYSNKGMDALKIRHYNDIDRKRIIETGADIKLRVHEEYCVWKGFLYGFIAAIPLIVMILINGIILLSGGTSQTLVTITGVAYMVFYSIFRVLVGEFTAVQLFGLLYAVPVMMCITGIPYILGARKARKQFDSIEQTKKTIYGDKK